MIPPPPHAVPIEFPDPPATGPGADTIASGSATNESNVLRTELAGQKDVNLNLTADFDSFKRRSRQESEARAAAQKDSFIRELLPVMDNLERALYSSESIDSLTLHQGVEMTWQQMIHLLHKHGIEAEECVGKPFDPHRHEAVAQCRNPAQPNHAILEVLLRGYRRGKNVFRPARVVVNDLSHPNEVNHAR
jgi:molecular chaperone GrpE